MTEVSLAHVAKRVTDTQSLLLLMHPDHEGTPRFKSHPVVFTHHTDFHHKFVHGSGASVLTCGDSWDTVSREHATGETSDTGIVVKRHGHS